MTSVSIIIPSYNACRYLAAAIRSAAAATADLEAEIVVVDDGSDDGTDLVVDALGKDVDLTLVRHDENRGKLAALNSASRAISGDLVVVLDADDVIEPNYVHRTSEAIAEHDVDFVYTSCTLIDESGAAIGHGASLPFQTGLIDRYSFIPDCALTTAHCFRSVIPLDERVRRLPKHYRWRRICSLGYRGRYLPEPLLQYRMHDENMSGIGAEIRSQLVEGRLDHHLLSGYWEARTEFTA